MLLLNSVLCCFILYFLSFYPFSSSSFFSSSCFFFFSACLSDSFSSSFSDSFSSSFSKLAQKISNDKNLTALQKKIKLTELAGADEFLLKRQKELAKAQEKINSKVQEYERKRIEIQKIQDKTTKDKEQKKLDDLYLAGLTYTYEKLFDTTRDIQTSNVIENILKEKTSDDQGKYGYKLKVLGGNEEEERLDLISFGFGKEASKKKDEENESEKDEEKESERQAEKKKKQEEEKKEDEEKEKPEETDD